MGKVCTISGREIALTDATDGQVAQFGRAIAAAQRAGLSGEAAVTAIARALDVMVAVVEKDVDRNFIDDGLTDGSINLDDMKVVMEAFSREEAPKNGPVAKKRGVRAQR